MERSAGGLAIDCIWRDMAERYPNVRLDYWITMPDHLHAIVILSDSRNPAASNDFRPGLIDFVGAFKSISTNEWIRGVKEQGWPRFAGKLWQRGFYDHVIRTEESLRGIRRYIRENPCSPDTASLL
jgi:REP element-mobilizing transposase RayT